MASECTSLLILSKSVQQNKLPVLTLKLIKRLNAPRLNETKIATENASNWDHFRFRSNKKLEYDKELCFGLLCRILACTLTLSRQIMLIYVFLPVWFFQILYHFPFFLASECTSLLLGSKPVQSNTALLSKIYQKTHGLRANKHCPKIIKSSILYVTIYVEPWSKAIKRRRLNWIGLNI